MRLRVCMFVCVSEELVVCVCVCVYVCLEKSCLAVPSELPP